MPGPRRAVRALPAGLAVAGVLCAGATSAQAALDARAVLVREGPADFRLVTRNTGDAAIGNMTWQSAPGHGYTHPVAPGARCSALRDGVACEGFALAPGRTLTLTFRADRGYPRGVGGFLLLSSPDESQAAGPLPVRYVATGEPVAGRSQRVERLRGVVRVRRRGSRRFVRMRGGRLLPDRSEIDTRRGAVRITVAGEAGRPETAVVSGGRAIVDQNARARPTTTLRLAGGPACRGAAAAAARRPRSRRLVVRTRGARIRTAGRFATAAARGTAWRTTDRCTSTRIDAREGVLRVRDLVRRRTITLRAPRAYRARRGPAR